MSRTRLAKDASKRKITSSHFLPFLAKKSEKCAVFPHIEKKNMAWTDGPMDKAS